MCTTFPQAKTLQDQMYSFSTNEMTHFFFSEQFCKRRTLVIVPETMCLLLIPFRESSGGPEFESSNDVLVEGGQLGRREGCRIWILEEWRDAGRQERGPPRLFKMQTLCTGQPCTLSFTGCLSIL